jgi:hypothetical protein
LMILRIIIRIIHRSAPFKWGSKFSTSSHLRFLSMLISVQCSLSVKFSGMNFCFTIKCVTYPALTAMLLYFLYKCQLNITVTETSYYVFLLSCAGSVTVLSAQHLRSWHSVARPRIHIFFTTGPAQIGSGTLTASYKTGTAVSFSGVRRLQCNGGHSPLLQRLTIKFRTIHFIIHTPSWLAVWSIAETPYLLTYLLTYSLHGAVIVEELTGVQLVKKFPAFYGTRMFITAVTSARHLSLSWASSIQSIPRHSTSWRSIFFSSLLCRGLSSGIYPSGFPTKVLFTPLFSPIRATCPAHLILLDFITRTV